MSLYFTQNLLIFTLCICALVLLRNAPARQRFYVCMLALTCWLIPWSLLQWQFPTEVISHDWQIPQFPLPEINFDVSTAINAGASATAPFWQINWSWTDTLTLILLVGIGLFIRDIFSYLSLQRQWRFESESAQELWQLLNIAHPPCEIRRLGGHGRGMLTGFIKPVIWLDADLHDRQKLQLILQHELTHLRQQDPRWLWLITLVQRLCWWNPLVLLFAHYARQQMELSCDEQCKTLMPANHYQTQLIELILSHRYNSQFNPAVLSMGFKSKFNLKRIIYLNEERTMKTRHSLVMIALIATSTFSGLTATAQNISNTGTTTEVVTKEFDWSIAQPLSKLFEASQFDEMLVTLEPLLKDRQVYAINAQEFILSMSSFALLLSKKDIKQGFEYANEYLALLKLNNNKKYIEQLAQFGGIAMYVGEEFDGYNIALTYFEEYETLAPTVNAHTAMLMAQAYFMLERYSKAEKILSDMINSAENKAEKPKENWLKLLAATQEKTGQQSMMAETFTKLVNYYPTEKNLETKQKLIDMGLITTN